MAIKIIYLVLALILAVGAVAYNFNNDVAGQNEDGSITYTCYNADEVQVSCSTGQPLSIVQGTPGIASVAFTVNAHNTGDIPLTCSVVSASPGAFNTAIPKTLKVVTAGGTSSWTSSAVSMAPLEALTQPVSFQATLRCSYRQGTQTVTLADKVSSIALTITSDAVNAGFNVDFTPVDTGAVTCGDGSCSLPVENAVNCPSDCGVTTH